MRTVSTNTCSSVSSYEHHHPLQAALQKFSPLPSKAWGEDNRPPQPSPVWSLCVLVRMCHLLPALPPTVKEGLRVFFLEKTAEIRATAPLILLQMI